MKVGVVIALLTLCLTVSMADLSWVYSVFEDGVQTVERWWQPFYDVYPVPVPFIVNDLAWVGDELWYLGRGDKYAEVVPEGVAHVELGPVGELFYRVVEGFPGTDFGGRTMIPREGELLVCSGGNLATYRPGEDAARYVGGCERPLADLTVFGGDLYGWVEPENPDEPGPIVRLDFDGADMRVAEELPIEVWKTDSLFGFIAADETGFWVYDDFLLGLVHVLPDGTRDRWLPMPDSGHPPVYALEDGALEIDWPATRNLGLHGRIRGEVRGAAAVWRPNELLIKGLNTDFVWVLDLDSAPVLEVPERWLVITADGLNLRAGPGAGFDKVRLLKKWDQALVCGETTVGDDAWYRVVTFAGETGWLCAGQGGESWVIVYPPGEAPFLSYPSDA
ncbi:MAG: SH3 domain-containing protein [bacterium]|nr:SH3 domain-containing protein [bacterium]